MAEVHCFPLEGRGSMIWNTLKFGAQLVKDGLFRTCHSKSKALFWLNSWEGYPPILTTHPQLHSLYQNFSPTSWDIVNFYNIAYVQGLAPSFHSKHPFELPLRGSEDDRKELFHILQSHEFPSLVGNDVLVWESEDLYRKNLVSVGYVELLRQTLWDIQMPWLKQVWNKFSWPKSNFLMWLVVHSRCLTWDNLWKSGCQSPSMCVLCQNSEENISQLFFHYSDHKPRPPSF